MLNNDKEACDDCSILLFTVRTSMLNVCSLEVTWKLETVNAALNCFYERLKWSSVCDNLAVCSCFLLKNIVASHQHILRLGGLISADVLSCMFTIVGTYFTHSMFVGTQLFDCTYLIIGWLLWGRTQFFSVCYS